MSKIELAKSQLNAALIENQRLKDESIQLRRDRIAKSGASDEERALAMYRLEREYGAVPLRF